MTDTLGEFTKANGQVRQCRVLWKTRKGLLKVQYVERGQTVVGYISPDEFRPDDARRHEKERLRH